MNRAMFTRSRPSLNPSVKKVVAVSDPHAAPVWQTKDNSHSQAYVEAVHRGNLTQVQAPGIREEELSWLKRCLLAEVKTYDLLNDLSSLLEEAGLC